MHVGEITILNTVVNAVLVPRKKVEYMVCKQPVQLQCFPKQNPNLTVLKSTSSAMLLNTQLHRQKITIPIKCPKGSALVHVRTHVELECQ